MDFSAYSSPTSVSFSSISLTDIATSVFTSSCWLRHFRQLRFDLVALLPPGPLKTTMAIQIPIVFDVSTLVVSIFASPPADIVPERLIPLPFGICSSPPVRQKYIVSPVICRRCH